MAIDERFRGIDLLYSNGFADYLKNQTVMIIGIGGVGSWSCETLIRSGIEKLILVDLDEVCVSNFNRQSHTQPNTIGMSKTTAMANKLKEINPNCEIQEVQDFYTQSTSEKILSLKPNWVIDAIDSLSPKCMLISETKKKNMNLVVTGGAGGKKDPNQINISDLNHSINDGLLARARKKLRKEYKFPQDKEAYGIKCVYSKEKTYIIKDNDQESEKKRIINCHNGLGTASFITAQFGMMAASIVINEIYEEYTNRK